ncbi:MAG: hypothetical protein ACTHK7_21640 [Aureliella sp.]
MAELIGGPFDGRVMLHQNREDLPFLSHSGAYVILYTLIDGRYQFMGYVPWEIHEQFDGGMDTICGRVQL